MTDGATSPSPYGQNGGPVTVALVALEAKRVDDLREVEVRRQDDLRAAEARRTDGLREAESKHRRELDLAESRRLDSKADAEARRIDAVIAADRAAVLLANTEARLTAAALAERVETAAKALAAAAGSKEQALEGRSQSQWTIERVITIAVAGLGLLYFLLNNAPRAVPA